MVFTSFARIVLVAFTALATAPVWAQGGSVGLVEKKVFTLPSYTTAGGAPLTDVKIGYETYGKLNAAGDNAIMLPHFFTGNSHAAGKYKAEDAAPGYWDSIIGPGKPIDTDKFFVVSADTLVNLNTKDPNTTTTGPATINPATGKPWGMEFPIVTFRDFVNVQKALLDSLGVKKLHAAIGASMGALQSVEWAAAYPDFVDRLVPVIGVAEIDAYSIERLSFWASAITNDPNWNKGDYYGKAEPTVGVAFALKMVTLDTRHQGWAERTFGRKWAAADKDPAKSWDNKFLIEDALDKAGAARARTADANSFLYLVKANQLFVAGHAANLEEGLARIKAKSLFIPAQSDLLLVPDYAKRAVDILRKQGKSAELVTIEGDGGHLDGVFAIAKVGEQLRQFLQQ